MILNASGCKSKLSLSLTKAYLQLSHLGYRKGPVLFIDFWCLCSWRVELWKILIHLYMGVGVQFEFEGHRPKKKTESEEQA